MSGFSPEWLALREPADLAARSTTVLATCQDYFKNRSALHICDMGAGTGASLRALAHLLPARRQWTLIDHDAANLAVAEKRHPGVHTLVRDFARTPDCWPDGAELVTASALLDLTSKEWIESFVNALAARRLPLLATLTVDGVLGIAPQQPLDDAVFAAFRAHQARDKGFGPAAGGGAPMHLESALTAAGYKITVGDSPWRIDPSQIELMRALLDGMATAVSETGLVPGVDQWLRAAADTTLLTVGHRDIFAVP